MQRNGSLTRVAPTPLAVAIMLSALGCSAPDYVSLGRTTPIQASGLPWPSGVNVWSVDEIRNWEAFRGRLTDVVGIIPDYGSWDSITKPSALLAEYGAYEGQIVIAEPFWPLGSGGDLTTCSQGGYDARWNDFGTTLVQAERPNAIVRLAWQFNGTDVEWKDSDKPSWLACFRRVSAAIRAKAPRALIDWSMSVLGPLHPNGSAFDVYPGDDSVDIVGADAYDMTPASLDETQWSSYCNGPEGLCQIADFARSHHKRLGIGQWAVVTCGAYTDRGGDNPFFIGKMHGFFVDNADIMAFEHYYNDHNPNEFCTSLNDPVEAPLASARYQALWAD